MIECLLLTLKNLIRCSNFAVFLGEPKIKKAQMTVERFVDNSVEISQVSGYDNLKNLFQQTVGDLIDSVDD